MLKAARRESKEVLTLEGLGVLGPPGGVLLQAVADHGQHDLELGVVCGGGVGYVRGVLGVCPLRLGALCIVVTTDEQFPKICLIQSAQ